MGIGCMVWSLTARTGPSRSVSAFPPIFWVVLLYRWRDQIRIKRVRQVCYERVHGPTAQIYQSSNLTTKTLQNEGNVCIFVIYALILITEHRLRVFWKLWNIVFFFLVVQLSSVGVWPVNSPRHRGSRWTKRAGFRYPDYCIARWLNRNTNAY